MTAASIPVIDITPFVQGSSEDKLNVAKQVAAACETFGSLNIAGHGVSPELIAAMCAVSQVFLVVSQVRRAKLGFVYQVKVLILEALARHQIPSVA